MHLEGPCKPIDPGIEAAASFFNSTGRRKQKTRPLKIEISANGLGFLELAYLGVLPVQFRNLFRFSKVFTPLPSLGGIGSGSKNIKKVPARAQ